MLRFSYIAVLVFIFLGTVWLEIILKARVYQKLKRLILTIIPVVVLMVIWDYYAIINNHWFFDPEKTTGITLIGFLPLEELLFFIIVPIAALLSFEAVRSIKKEKVGDE
ncbi:MAG: lycopene cyclase domain-containing protein [Actinomycetes bacterium]|jgi:lycopene cyclase domain-containing protein